jgi:hypothetical protein
MGAWPHLDCRELDAIDEQRAALGSRLASRSGQLALPRLAAFGSPSTSESQHAPQIGA